jgi:indole-3-glycerol phosphate synthase
MSILQKIAQVKRGEVATRKRATPAEQLKESAGFSRPVISLVDAIGASPQAAVIAEFKRKSPSRGVINDQVTVEDIASGYSHAGAAALSVLTDELFFGGSLEDLSRARRVTPLPVLRKDFILDQYQLLEARAIGADVILLIAAMLEPREAADLALQARQLNLEVLLEVHNQEEYERYSEVPFDLIGVNNRDLNTFSVGLDVSVRLASILPAGKPWISESGLSNPADVQRLYSLGFRGFLMGEHFMRTPRPAEAARLFIQQLTSAAS